MAENKFGTYHLASLPKQYQPQTTNNFELIVTGVDNLVRAGMYGNESNAVIKNAQEVLRLSIDQSFIPSFSQNKIEVARGNNKMYFAGAVTFSEGSFTFNCYIGAETKDILLAWQNQSYNILTEKVGCLDVTPYKKKCYLIEYTPDYRKIRQWVIEGCWIQGLNQGSFNQSQNEKMQITATISYDWAKIDYSADI